MKTDIEYLTLLEEDLQQAATRETWMKAAPPNRHRSWAGWGTFAAGVVGFLVVAGLIGLVATNGGLGGSSDDKAAAGAASSIPATREPFSGNGAAGATGATGGAVFQTAPSLDQAPAVGPPQSGDVSKIIRDGTMSIQVAKDGFSDGFAAVTRIAQNNGGFVLSSQIRGQRTGTLTLRIPARRFDDAMLALRDIGVVQAQSITGKDVTAQFIDLRARLQNAIGQRAVLRNLMARATTIQETITVQNRLSGVELQVEQIQGQLNFIDDQVAEATVRVELHEKDAAQIPETDSVENPSLGSAWDRSIQGFLNVVAAVVIGLGYLIPLGILGLGAWLLTLAVRRRRGAS
ncbi:MAG: DUF4349 domain-containing protein [Actinomycetota bacterium]